MNFVENEQDSDLIEDLKTKNQFLTEIGSRVNDIIENAGPLAGVYTGLHYTLTNNNLVVSCDVPLINTETLILLTEQIEDKIDVIQLESMGKTMPLIALYKKQCKDICYALLQNGERRLRIALNHMKVKTITLDKNQAKYTININTPDNLKEIADEIKH